MHVYRTAQINGFQIVAQFVGGVGVSWFIINTWRYTMIWCVFGAMIANDCQPLVLSSMH